MNTAVGLDEVLAAVNERSVYRADERDPKPRGLTKADVADHLAEKRGLTNAMRSRQYQSRTSALRPFVSLGDVKRHLETLVRDGKIVEVGGDHWSMSQQYGTNSRATYYMSLDARDLIRGTAGEKEYNDRYVKAMETAKEEVLEKHEDEVSARFLELTEDIRQLPKQW